MARAYYALVAGLPDFALDGKRLPYSTEEFWIDSDRHLHPDDRSLLGILCLPVDNYNVLNLLDGRVKSFKSGGNFSRELLENELKVPSILPGYLRLFIEQYKGDVKRPAGMTWETVMAGLFYQEMLGHKNVFIRDWFELDQNIRNVLVALSCRKLGQAVDGQLVGDNSVSAAIRKNNSGDFGLGREFSFIEKILTLYDDRNLLEREQGIDKLRWKMLDQMTVFEYFSIERVMAFFLKLQIAERWYRLDPETGKQMFDELLEDLRSELDLSKEFSVSGGK